MHITYTIIPGDTIKDVAERLETDPDKLYELNKDRIGSDRNAIIPRGTELLVPILKAG